MLIKYSLWCLQELRDCLLRPGLRINAFLADLSTFMALFLLREASSSAAAGHELTIVFSVETLLLLWRRHLWEYLSHRAFWAGHSSVNQHEVCDQRSSRAEQTDQRMISSTARVIRKYSFWVTIAVFWYHTLIGLRSSAKTRTQQLLTFPWLYKCTYYRIMTNEIRGKIVPLTIRHYELS